MEKNRQQSRKIQRTPEATVPVRREDGIVIIARTEELRTAGLDWRTSPAVPPPCRTDEGTMATRSRPGKPQESLPDRDPSVLTNGELV